MRTRLAAIAFCGLAAGCVPTYVPEQVTTDKLLSLTRDMTYEQVEAVIGPPLCVYKVEDSTLDEAQLARVRELIEDCGPFQTVTRSVPPDLRRAASVRVSYAEPRQVMSVDIYVHFKAGMFESVYVKEFDNGICCQDASAEDRYYSVGSRERLVDLIGR